MEYARQNDSGVFLVGSNSSIIADNDFDEPKRTRADSYENVKFQFFWREIFLHFFIFFLHFSLFFCIFLYFFKLFFVFYFII